MSSIQEDIKTNSFHTVYLVFGPESYLVRFQKNRLIQALGGRDSMNFRAFSGKGVNLHELIDQAEMMPFFADRRLILIEDTDLFERKEDSLVKYMEEIPASSVLLFVQESVDKRGRLYKAIQKVGVICECERQNEPYLKRFIAGYLDRAGIKITHYTLDLFLTQVGNDMELISHELDKLIAYTQGRNVVEPEDVEAVCTISLESKIFDLTDAISEQNPERTLRIYHDLTELHEEPMHILALLVWQFRMLMQVKELSGQGLRQKEIAERIGAKPFSVKKCLSQCDRFTLKQLRSAFSDCLKYEELFKSGRIGADVGLEMLLIRYSRQSSAEKPLFSDCT